MRNDRRPAYPTPKAMRSMFFHQGVIPLQTKLQLVIHERLRANFVCRKWSRLRCERPQAFHERWFEPAYEVGLPRDTALTIDQQQARVVIEVAVRKRPVLYAQ